MVQRRAQEVVVVQLLKVGVKTHLLVHLTKKISEVEVKQIEVEVHQNFGADVRAEIDQSEQDYQNKVAAATDESEKEKLAIDHMKGDTDQTLSGPWFVMHATERGVFNHLPSGKYFIRIV